MRSLSASQLLNVWEQGENQDSIKRALLLLCAAYPEKSRDEVASMSLGRRDACLFELQQSVSPGALQAFAKCPACDAALEYRVPAEQLWGDAKAVAEEPRLLKVDGLSVRLRLPNSLDLEAARLCTDPSVARIEIAHRCTLELRRDGKAAPVEELPERAIEQISVHLANADPQAELLVDLRCPECRHSWQELFEIVAYLWTQVRALATQILWEVHVLARAYGWREQDVLAMSAARRQLYLEMLD